MNGYSKIIIGSIITALLGAYGWATIWPVKLTGYVIQRIDRLEDRLNQQLDEIKREVLRRP